MGELSDYISDFASSEYFLFLTGTIKEYAESLLRHFAEQCPQPFTLPEVESTLHAMARLDLPQSAKTDLPDLLAAYFSYLASSGKMPAASAWEEYPAIVKPGYLALFREDGTIRGTTYRRQYSPTGRNDPCPCGSGKKFKKCCGRE